MSSAENLSPAPASVVAPNTAGGSPGSGVTFVKTNVAIGGAAAIAGGEQMGLIACCLCGVKIESNPSNMCVNCLQHHIDLASAIPKNYALPQCPNCDRFESGGHFVEAQFESRELLAICLKKMSRLQKEAKLIDASFIWTEPHSKRLKIKLTIQREVFAGALMQQSFLVEFVITSQQCIDCQKSFTQHTWTACVQVRQKLSTKGAHRKTLLYLEQMMLKSGAAAKAMNIKEEGGGLDFYFQTKSQAVHLVDYLTSVVPVKVTQSIRVVSINAQNNTTTSKHTFGVEVAPICKNDLVILPSKLIQHLGGGRGIGPLLLCYRVTATIYLIDPVTLRTVDISASVYFRNPFVAVLSEKQMIEYTIIDIERDDRDGDDQRKTNGNTKDKPSAKPKAKKPTTSEPAVSDVKANAATAKQSEPEPTLPLSAAIPTPAPAPNASAPSPAPVPAAAPTSSVQVQAPAAAAEDRKDPSRVRHVNRLSLATATVARSSDLGVNNDVGFAVTHLGNLLKAGDLAMGYDVTSIADAGDDDGGASLKHQKLPDIVLVKKTYDKTKRKSRGRNFRLKRLAKVGGGSGGSAGSGGGGKKKKAQANGSGGASVDGEEKDFDDFMADLEYDPEMRKNVNLYAAASAPNKSKSGSTAAKPKPGSTLKPVVTGAAVAAVPAGGGGGAASAPSKAAESDTESLSGAGGGVAGADDDGIRDDELIVEPADGDEPQTPTVASAPPAKSNEA